MLPVCVSFLFLHLPKGQKPNSKLFLLTNIIYAPKTWIWVSVINPETSF